MDAYSFQANAGDVVQVQMTEVTSSFEPEVELFDDRGTSLGSIWHSTEATLDVELTSDGTFFILASDRIGDDVGSYTMTVQLMSVAEGTSTTN